MKKAITINISVFREHEKVSPSYIFMYIVGETDFHQIQNSEPTPTNTYFSEA